MSEWNEEAKTAFKSKAFKILKDSSFISGFKSFIIVLQSSFDANR